MFSMFSMLSQIMENPENPENPDTEEKEEIKYDPKNAETQCVKNKNGLYCAAYLAGNGYDMDY